jgi:Domain of unknown function (DUF222)
MEVSIVPAAAPGPETQEEILAAVLAARDERDIPAEDDSWVITDSDGDRPAELAGLDGAELHELLAAAPPRPSEQTGLAGLSGSAGLAKPAASDPASPCRSGPAGPGAEGRPAGPGAESRPAGLVAEGAPAEPGAEGRPAGPGAEGGPAGPIPGFAEGGVLDGLAPGVALAGFADDAHAGLTGLTDDELIGVLRAWARQASWSQARELAVIAELARRRPADGTPPARPGQLSANVSEFTADEVGFALTLTRRSAGALLDLALALAARPDTADLLRRGEIDLLKARVIIDGITGLAEAHAAAVEAAVLPEAPAMTRGQLRAAVAQAVLAVDPDAAHRDREERLKDARVECWTDPTGTANLAGRDLPSAETLAADQRLCQIARIWKKQISAAWKQVGPAGQQSRPAGQQSRPAVGTDLLRARAYLALLLGQPADTPPADLLPGPDPAPGARRPPGPGPARDARPAPGTAPGPGARRAPGSPAFPGSSQPGPDGTGAPGHGPDSIPGPSHSADGDIPSPSHSAAGDPADGAPAADLPPGLRRPGSGDALPPLAGQVFLTLPLATLLGLSDAPGQAAGYGPLDPDTGRALARAAAGHPAAGWHLIITGQDGRAVGYGHPPCARPVRGHPADGWTITLTTERIARGQSP